jgi:hypothetical protein
MELPAPWGRELLEKSTVQLVTELHIFYGTKRLIIMFIKAHHLSLLSSPCPPTTFLEKPVFKIFTQ